jgi:Leucine-rich repeat (LRR) protein
LKGLQSLDMMGNGISDLSPLAGMTELRFLFLDRNKITDLQVLVEMAKTDIAGEKRFAPFCRIFLKENPLSDAAKGPQVEELKKLVKEVSL